MIGDTTSECDGVSTTAVQSSSAAIDRGTGGVEGNHLLLHIAR